MALRLSLVAVLLLFSAASTTTTTAAAAQALPADCPDKCGNLTIPYPFGMKKGCYLRKEFFINCKNTTQGPTAYLMEGNIIVTNISLDDGELQILANVAEDCYNAEGNRTSSFRSWLELPLPYTISDSKNKFYAVGCDTYATMHGLLWEDEFITGCVSVCYTRGSVDKKSCSGAGCCQTNIPSGLYNLTVRLNSYFKHSYVLDFNPCSYAFIAEQGKFNFSPTSFEQLNGTEGLPMVLNWAIGNERDACDGAQKRKDLACRGNYSMCINRPINESGGYLCRCLPDYEGNPYHPDGCQGGL
ncbi:wall-associated receptor kinase 2-like [Rosa chinensis]|uniref:wall-associated receptor kinase 2-like n=1 Tax=Rosa chinensis TaxID=74649 RepID=UPI000D08DD43|nr:wall-associated receptor kinase 2-like [Rosa chinensis]